MRISGEFLRNFVSLLHMSTHRDFAAAVIKRKPRLQVALIIESSRVYGRGLLRGVGERRRGRQGERREEQGATKDRAHRESTSG